MAYFGKEFKLDKEENNEAFNAALAKVNPKVLGLLSLKPISKLLKSGDEYTLVFTSGDLKKELTFKAGVPFKYSVIEGLEATITVTVTGDTFTHVLDFGSIGTLTSKREYSADLLKVTTTASIVDGSAIRYYVPV